MHLSLISDETVLSYLLASDYYLILTDSNKNIILANDKAKDFFNIDSLPKPLIDININININKDIISKYTAQEKKYFLKIKSILIKKENTELYLLIVSKLSKKELFSKARKLKEYKSKDSELRNSHDNFKFIIENQRDLIIKLDSDGRFLFASKSYCETFNIDEDELIGKIFMPEIHPDDLEITNSIIQNCISPPYHAYLEHRALTSQGWVWFAWTINTVLDKNGNPKEIVAVGRDINNLKEVEQLLVHQRDSAQSLINSAPAIICYTDLNFNIKSINNFAFKYTRSEDRNLLSRNLNSLFGFDQALLDNAKLNLLTNKTTQIDTISSEFDKKCNLEWICTKTKLEPISDGYLFIGIDITNFVEMQKISQLNRIVSEKIIEQSYDGIYITDCNSRIIEWNTAQSKITGIKPEDAKGRFVWDVLSLIKVSKYDKIDTLKKRIKDIYHELINDNDCKYFYKITERDSITITGDHICTQSITFPVITDDCKYIATINRDISKQKQIQLELEDSEKMFKAAFFNAASGMILTDKDGIISQCNSALCEMLNLNQEDIVGKSGFDFIPEKAKKIGYSVQQKMIDGRFENIVDQIILDNNIGKRITAIFGASLIRSKSGEPKHFICQIQDITGFKIIERELNRYKITTQNIISNLPLLVWGINKKGVIEFSEGKAFDDLGINASEYVGKTIYEIHRNAPEIVDYFKRALEGQSFMLTTMHKNIVFEAYFFPVFDNFGKVINVVGFAMDVSQNKIVINNLSNQLKEIEILNINLQQELKSLSNSNQIILKEQSDLINLNDSKDKFLSLIAHDIRSPFQGFLNLSSILMNDISKLQSDEIVELARNIHDSASSLNNLLENLLFWSKIQRNGISLNKEQLNLKHTIDLITDIFKLNLYQKGLSLEIEIEDNIELNADLNSINTVVRNLISNAIKFSFPGNKIVIKAFETNDHISISVRDFGLGMHGNQIQDILNKQQINSSSGTLNEKGSGIGLVLCRELIELNEAEFKINSSLGEGSEFIIIFPK